MKNKYTNSNNRKFTYREILLYSLRNMIKKTRYFHNKNVFVVESSIILN